MENTPSHKDMPAIVTEKEIQILYVNYRGKESWRRIQPDKIWFGFNEWHPEPQWLMDAIDLDKQSERTFAIKDIQVWKSPEAAVIPKEIGRPS